MILNGLGPSGPPISRRFPSPMWHMACHGWLRAPIFLLIGLRFASAEPPDRLEIGRFEGNASAPHVVLVSGDEEYRSEEALPLLATILARKNAFRCTVLFSLDDDRKVNPNRRDNIPGLETLSTADLLVIFTRFRSLPPKQMRFLDDYLRRGAPVVGMRTATHAFAMAASDPFAYFSHDSIFPGYEGGFGRRVLGEQWVAHHGDHGKESTRGVIADGAANHPVLHGVTEASIWGPTDVYQVRLPMPQGTQVLVQGEVLAGMSLDSPAVKGTKNEPRMPIAWTKPYSWQGGPEGRSFTTTMGASQDLLSASLRRLLVNACYWAAGRASSIPESLDVSLPESYQPTPFGFDKFRTNLYVSDFLPQD